MFVSFTTVVRCQFLVVICCLHVSAGVASTCNFPPSVWCSSEHIATKCQVADQCNKYVWNIPPGDIKKVDFAVYIESLCSDCKNFFARQLWPTWKKVRQIMNLKIIPYGNAMEEKTTEGWNFTCQHGPQECIGNTIETCAIYTVKNISVYFPFINCLEKSMEVPYKTYVKCAQNFGLDVDMIKKCAFGPYGNTLEHRMAELTNRLDPPHTYVPWVTLNGVHTKKIQEEAEENLLKLICDSYKGPRPGTCPQPGKHTSLKEQQKI